MSKGAYYAGMATAPQVKPADFLTPFANMAERISQQAIEQRKQQQAEQAANEKFVLSRQDKLQDTINSSGYKGIGINNLDMAVNEYMTYLQSDFEKANEEFNITKDKKALSAKTSALQYSAKQVQNLGNRIANFVKNDGTLEANGKASMYNDVVMAMIQDLGDNIGFETESSGVQRIYTEGEDGNRKTINAKTWDSLFTAKQSTDLNGVLEDIVEMTQPRQIKGENNTFTRYLDYSKDANGTLTQSQADILTRRLQNFEPHQVYDAAVRAGLVGDGENQIPLRTDFSDEGVIANIDQMREALAIKSIGDLQNMYRNKEGSKPNTGGSRTPGSSSVTYNPDTMLYSYKKGSATSVLVRAAFTGKDVIDNQPSGKSEDVPSGAYISDVRITPFGLEVYGTMAVNKQTGDIMDIMNANSMSDIELETKGAKKVNFHKIIDPGTNSMAIGQLQRVFEFDIDEYNNMLKLNNPGGDTEAAPLDLVN